MTCMASFTACITITSSCFFSYYCFHHIFFSTSQCYVHRNSKSIQLALQCYIDVLECMMFFISQIPYQSLSLASSLVSLLLLDFFYVLWVHAFFCHCTVERIQCKVRIFFLYKIKFESIDFRCRS